MLMARKASSKTKKGAILTNLISQSPAGFLSYVRADDQHERGRLTEFAERLSGEVRMQSGDTFQIFQDRNDIAWGQQWKSRVDESVDGATFLITIITPTFFKSPQCRDELQRFLDREKQLKRADLILPVYYVNCPILNDERKRVSDPLAKILSDRQYADWRELRFEPFTSPQIGKTLAKMATQIVEALERGQGERTQRESPKAIANKKRDRKLKNNTKRKVISSTASDEVQSGSAGTRSEAGELAELAESERGPAQKTEAPTLVVDALHRGDHSTLTDALAAAKPGHRILVRPGLYREGVVIDKPVEVIGDGELGDVVIEATGANVILFKANMGRVANLTLRQAGGEAFYGVDITQGRLDLEGCDITSQGLTCVAIHGGADPRLRRNVIHNGEQAGVAVFGNAQGTLEDNDIFGNTLSGVYIKDGGNPTLRRNRIHDGMGSGVFVHDKGQGTIEDNDIFGNALSGVEIKEEGNPTLRRNRIHDGKQVGVYVNKKGRGTLEDNDIFENRTSGLFVKGGGNPTLRHNRISKNGGHAITIVEGGGGVFEENDLRDNAKGAWLISAESKDRVKRKANRDKDLSE